MPAPLLAKDEILARMFDVFRTYGYEGATMARISESTGLGRASLYHYFPGGKDDMARDVLATARAWLQANVVETLGGGGTPGQRARALTQALRRGYADGAASCVVNLLGVGDANKKFGAELGSTAELWIGAFERFLRDSGASASRARRVGIDALVRIEGALVLSRALGDNAVFIRSLSDVEHLLLDEVNARG